MNKISKIQYIYNTIQNENINHQTIYNYILKYNIVHSKNNNGMFVNISSLSIDQLDNLYYLVKNTNQLTDPIINNPFIHEKNKNIMTIKKDSDSTNYKSLSIDNHVDQYLLELSKTI